MVGVCESAKWSAVTMISSSPSMTYDYTDEMGNSTVRGFSASKISLTGDCIKRRWRRLEMSVFRRFKRYNLTGVVSCYHHTQQSDSLCTSLAASVVFVPWLLSSPLSGASSHSLVDPARSNRILCVESPAPQETTINTNPG